MREISFDKDKQRKIREGFAWIQYSIFDDDRLSSSDIIVYLTLARFSNNETQECHPSKKTLIKYARLTEPTIRKSLYNLRDLGYIDINQKAGKVNYYQLNDPQKIYDTNNNGDTTKKERSLPPKKKGTNNTNYNNTNINNTNNINSKEDFSSLKRIIIKFREVNPSYERFFSNTTEQSAIKRLLKKYGEQNLIRLIDKVKETNELKYAPVITKPTELESKLAKLQIFLKQQGEEVFLETPSNFAKNLASKMQMLSNEEKTEINSEIASEERELKSG